MIPAGFPRPPSGPLRVLCLGAHVDDIEIGAAGMLMRLADEQPEVTIRVVVCSATPERAEEAAKALAAMSLGRPGGRWSHVVHRLPENLLNTCVAEVREVVADEVAFDPHLVVCPNLTDRHQDHRTLAEVAWQLLRDRLIWSYEIPKWEGDLITPNTYVPLTDELAETKLALLDSCFPSQRNRPWFDRDTFAALLRLRGVECGRRWAEGFTVLKSVV